MMNRRQLVCAAAGAALLARVPEALAATYDLIIKGGRVIDPSAGVDAICDVAIAGGKIVAVGANITGDATETIDARGKIVAPGLIDIHTHAGRSKEGPPMCLRDGVTGWVDAGSGGADNIDQVAAIAREAPQIGRALVNISRTGVTPDGELHDINRANVALAQGAIARNRDVVVGVKARLSNNVAGTNDLEALRRAQEAAAPFNLPVMIHVGQNYSPMRAILPLLKRGDIVTHMYAPGMNSILDEKGILFPDATAAPRRPVRLRQRRRRSLRLGLGGKGHKAGLLARYPLHRLEHNVEDHRRCRFPQRHVEVHHVRHAAQPDHRMCDRQRSTRVPVLR
jgi:dihydroorotase